MAIIWRLVGILACLVLMLYSGSACIVMLIGESGIDYISPFWLGSLCAAVCIFSGWLIWKMYVTIKPQRN